MMRKFIISSVLAFILVVLASPSPAGTLAVPVIYQQQEQWCWAASCQMILSYYGYSSTQCSMANWCFYQSTCCSNVIWPNGTGSSCNQPNYIYGYGRGMKEVLVQWGPIYSTGVGSYLAWSTVQSESNAGRPFVIGFSWTGGGGHAMVGRGYLSTNVYYNDPWPGNGYRYASYNWMVSASDHDWDQSLRLTTNPPTPSTTTRAPLQLYAGDFNGNGKANIAIFRPSSGLWSIRGVTRAYFGRSGDIPVPADYTGNGRAEMAIFRPSSGLWSIRGVTRFYFGQSGDYPIPMNYREGYTTSGIFRPSTGLWSFRGGGRFYFGRSGDIPVIGPWDTRSGKWGAPRIAIFRPSTGLWSIRGTSRFYFGRSGDTPVPGAYSTSSTEPWKAAIFRPSTGLWSIRGGARYYFGRSGDTPVPGDYAGTWGDEIAIFRPSTGLWSIRNGNRYYYGRTGDTPATR